jgi:ribosome-associated protein
VKGRYYTDRFFTAPTMQDERPSKTQRKQEVEALQRLGERLVGLNPEQLATVRLPDDLRDAVFEAKRIRSREGRRRQLQYIGKLMRRIDPAPIHAVLERWDGQSREATAAHHRVERWRLRLLEDDGALTEFAREHPHADLQRLRTCVREARKERLAGGEPRHFRDLFRLIRAAEAATGAEPPL